MKNSFSILMALLAFFFLTGFFGPDGDKPEEQRQTVQTMKNDTLENLYQLEPGTKQALSNAAGYAVFSNTGINLFLLSTANGWGVAHDNETGKDIYMKMFSGGVGIGLGVKDFRGVFIFTSKEALDGFIEHGWEAGGQADAAAKAGEKGGAFATAIDVAPGIKLYQITENGLALQATIQGTKYWKDEDLNQGI